MKTKSSQKQTQPKSKAAPPPVAWSVIHGKFKEGDPLPQHDYPPPLPNRFDFALRKYFPDVERDAPAWAKEAAKMAFKSAMPPERKRKASEKYLEGFWCGKFSEAEKLLPPEKRLPSPADYGGLTEIDLAAKLPSEQRADFFCGFSAGEQAVEAMLSRRNTLQTVKAYQAIAIHWREAEKFLGNAGELHGWLQDKGAFHHRADPAATRTICRKIGFATRRKAGRPSQADE